MTGYKHNKVKRIKLEFSPNENVTSFGGFAVVHRLMLRLGIPNLLASRLPRRRGYSLPEIAMSAMAGLLSGAQATVAAEPARQDPAFRALIGLERSPSGVTFWRSLEDFGSPEGLGALEESSFTITRKVLERSPRRSVYDHGFLPLFVDGTLLEGSPRREGTKRWKDGEAKGLLLTAGFVGPFPAAVRLANKGEGETTAARSIIPAITEGVLRPSGLVKDALVLMDSLHGNGPTLGLIESQDLRYIVGANGLKRLDWVLSEQPDSQWTPDPEYDEKSPGIEESAVCVASIQCKDWPEKRTLVGRRWKKKGEFVWNFAGVLTNLEPSDERLKCKNLGEFAKAVWGLYNRKGACENHFKNLLSDLGLHHPPCQRWQGNAGFYALGALAGLIGVATAILTSKPMGKIPRLATLRRWLLAVPARISCHARTAAATILGLSEWWRSWLAERFHRAARC